MVELTNLEAAANLLEHTLEGRLVQSTWHSENSKGQEVACMLGALHAGIDQPSACPSNVMPSWLASLIPGNFDSLVPSYIYTYGAEVADRMARWDVLTEEQWAEVKARLILAGMRETFSQMPDSSMVDLIGKSWLRKEILPSSVIETMTPAEQDFHSDLNYYPHGSTNVIEHLRGQTFFDALIAILDAVLPEPVEQDFTYSFPVTTYTTVVVREKSPVKAFYLAKKQHYGESAIPDAVQNVLKAAAATTEVLPWSDDVDAAIKVTREHAEANNREFNSGSSTIQVVPALKEYWGA